MQKARASPMAVGQDTYTQPFLVALTCSQHILIAWLLRVIKANAQDNHMETMLPFMICTWTNIAFLLPY